MRKRMAYHGSLYDLSGIGRWLERCAGEGLLLEKFSRFGNLAVFQLEEPKRTRYYLEPDFGQYLYDAEEANAHAEQGWRFVCKVPRVFRVYEAKDMWATKPGKWKLEEKQLRKKWRSLWSDLLLWLVGIATAGIQLIKSLFSPNMSYVNWLTILPIALGSGVLVFLAEFWKGLPSLYHIRIWRKSFILEEEVQPRPSMAFFYWGNQVLMPVILAAALLLPIIGELGSTRNTFSLSKFDQPLPCITLEVTEPEIHYPPDGYESGVVVSTAKALLVPEDIIIWSRGLFQEPERTEDWENVTQTGAYDARMQVHYYRLLRESMAIRLAEEEANGRDSKQVAYSAFDQLWLWEKQDGMQYLVARDGTVVFTISYQGSGSLSECLTDFKEMISDYRNP